MEAARLRTASGFSFHPCFIFFLLKVFLREIPVETTPYTESYSKGSRIEVYDRSNFDSKQQEASPLLSLLWPRRVVPLQCALRVCGFCLREGASGSDAKTEWHAFFGPRIPALSRACHASQYAWRRVQRERVLTLARHTSKIHHVKSLFYHTGMLQ